MKQFRFPGFTFIMVVSLLGFVVTDKADAQGVSSGSRPSMASGGAYGSVRQSNYNSGGYSSSGLRSKYSSSGLRSNYSSAGMRSSGYSSRGISSSTFDNEQYGSVRQAAYHSSDEPAAPALSVATNSGGQANEASPITEPEDQTAGTAAAAAVAGAQDGAAYSQGNANADNEPLTVEPPAAMTKSPGAAGIGSTFTTLPTGCSEVLMGNSYYYYHGGHFYQPSYDGSSWHYTIIPPPTGTTIFELPAGSTVLVVGGVNYYTFDGVYYRPAYVNGLVGYVVVAAPE